MSPSLSPTNPTFLPTRKHNEDKPELRRHGNSKMGLRYAYEISNFIFCSKYMYRTAICGEEDVAPPHRIFIAIWMWRRGVIPLLVVSSFQFGILGNLTLVCKSIYRSINTFSAKCAIQLPTNLCVTQHQHWLSAGCLVQHAQQ